MDCILCNDKGYVLVKGYQTDKHFKVNCPYCAEGRTETKEAVSLEKKTTMTCEYCYGVGEVTIEGQDGTPRIVICGHCDGSGNEPGND